MQDKITFVLRSFCHRYHNKNLYWLHQSVQYQVLLPYFWDEKFADDILLLHTHNGSLFGCHSVDEHSSIFYNVHFPLVTSEARSKHKSLVTLCAQVALIGVAGLLVLGHYLSRCKPLITLVTLHTLDLTVTSSLMLQGLGPTSESLATNTALVRPLV